VSPKEVPMSQKLISIRRLVVFVGLVHVVSVDGLSIDNIRDAFQMVSSPGNTANAQIVSGVLNLSITTLPELQTVTKSALMSQNAPAVAILETSTPLNHASTGEVLPAGTYYLRILQDNEYNWRVQFIDSESSRIVSDVPLHLTNPVQVEKLGPEDPILASATVIIETGTTTGCIGTDCKNRDYARVSIGPFVFCVFFFTSLS